MLRQAEALLENLEAFLLSDQVFWPMAGAAGSKSPYDLSLGQALLTQDALLALVRSSPPDDSARLDSAAQAIGAIRHRWAAAASRKADAEFPQRVNLWRAYLEEVREKQTSADEYPHQVRNRVIAQRLLPLMQAVASEPAQRLQMLDRSLERIFQPGGFAWDPGLVSAYPRPQFWFLYGGIRPTPG